MADNLSPLSPNAAQTMDNSTDIQVTLDTVITAVKSLGIGDQITADVAKLQKTNANQRTTSEQWLDENEHEWYHLDSMIRSRPWATNADKPFPYPFRKATNEMRQQEGQWIGDDRILAPQPTRFDNAKEGEIPVLTHVRPTPEYPAKCRVILFTPDFGSDKSYDMESWNLLEPENECDVWVCSWQGWASFEEMVPQVLRKLLAFGDGTSTVWFGHSTGAVIAYEMLKQFEEHYSPNLPVALVVSGCPAPSLYHKEYKPFAQFPELSRFQASLDFDDFKYADADLMEKHFQASLDNDISAFQRKCFLGDARIIRTYRCNHNEEKQRVVLPVLAIAQEDDPLVSEDSVKAWSEFSAEGFEFFSVPSGEYKYHGWTKRASSEVVSIVNECSRKYQRVTDVHELLKLPECDPGPTDKEVPEEIDFMIVGGGVMGIRATVEGLELGLDIICLEKYSGLGGVWNFYANSYSRVNTSEIGYRVLNKTGPTARPNEDHSPKHDILSDLHRLAHKAYGKFYCNKEITKVDPGEKEGTYVVHSKDVNTGKTYITKVKGICFCTNRRIGAGRIVEHKNQDKFLGEIKYGYGGDVHGLNFWNKKTIVVGAGAFAFENLRTSLEHGSTHCSILGRRAGTTSPKWIDVIAFIRPTDENFNTNKIGNAISFEYWRKCYDDAGLPTPECWNEGLLKPHNHTVSVSDMAYIGGYHGMVSLLVGEIDHFTTCGKRVALKDGRLEDVDIVIKATGFHIADQVPVITGENRMYANSMVKFNLFYNAEPLLDGGQFGSTKGKVTEEEADRETADLEDIYKAATKKAKDLGLSDGGFHVRNNPFGSGLVGPSMVNCKLIAHLMKNPEEQKAYLAVAGKPTQVMGELWASMIFSSANVIGTRCGRKLLELA